MTPADRARLPYRRGVGMMLLNALGDVFVAQRIDMPSDAWQMPQGGMDAGETPESAAWREMGEEIGTRAAVLMAESRDWYRYDLPDELVPRLWKGQYRGQEQKWFAFRFTGTDADSCQHELCEIGCGPASRRHQGPNADRERNQFPTIDAIGNHSQGDPHARVKYRQCGSREKSYRRVAQVQIGLDRLY